MRVLLTGAAGFLGWHTRVRLRVEGHDVVPVTRQNWARLPELVAAVDAVVHVAGVNRGPDDQVEKNNVTLARDVVAALRAATRQPQVVFANSIQSRKDTPYGRGKGRAADLLAAAAETLGLRFVDVALPNLFGEHGRPRYNSVVQTFVEAVITSEEPRVDNRPISLLHAQAAAQGLSEALTAESTEHLDLAGTSTSVQAVLDLLRHQCHLYSNGDVPPLTTDLEVDLFNTLRAALFPAHYPIALRPRADQRGSLLEVVRAHGGQGQTFVSTTRPGVTRGEHFHLRKVERFAVLSGRARISLRRLYHDQVVTFEVDGGTPAFVDMPTMWTHNITNTGDRELTTLFWTHELFDPDRTDTYPEPVECVGHDVPGEMTWTSS